MNSLARRIAVSCGLSLFFLLVYGGCQAISAARSHVPSFFFGWERHVPFVPAMILPYLSIDLFFITAPLLIRSDRALRAYALRIMLAISIAGAFFILLPLRFAFARPAVGGPLGTVFAQFQHADLPFNQLPSLHVALLLIVGDVFLRAAGGWLRVVLIIWFCLIGLSPLLVYQHHIVDLLAGLALGLIGLTYIPDESKRQPFDCNGRVAGYYAIAGLASFFLCLLIGRASWPLWWPALSLLLVAVGYAFLGPWYYIKRDGRLSLTTRLLFWPALLGQHASLHWYARRSNAYDRVTQRLWIGRKLTNQQAMDAIAAGVGAVIDLTCDFTEAKAFCALPYLHLPTLDLTAPTQAQIDRALTFIREHGEAAAVYIHCKAGYSRTAVVAASYLLATGEAATTKDAIALLRAARPSMIVRPEARRAIETFARRSGRVE